MKQILRMPMTKARINLGSLVKRVHVEGDVVVLEKDGIPIAGLVDIDVLEDFLDIMNPKLRKHITASMKDYGKSRVRPARELLEDLETTAESR